MKTKFQIRKNQGTDIIIAIQLNCAGERNFSTDDDKNH